MSPARADDPVDRPRGLAGERGDLLLLLLDERARGLVAVYVSITSLDPALARILEPRAAAPHRRLRTVEALARAGVPVGVSISPMIPFINEPEIERILEAAAAAGATSAFGIVLMVLVLAVVLPIQRLSKAND